MERRSPRPQPTPGVPSVVGRKSSTGPARSPAQGSLLLFYEHRQRFPYDQLDTIHVRGGDVRQRSLRRAAAHSGSLGDDSQPKYSCCEVSRMSFLRSRSGLLKASLAFACGSPSGPIMDRSAKRQWRVHCSMSSAASRRRYSEAKLSHLSSSLVMLAPLG
jgi:hypothetical protein